MKYLKINFSKFNVLDWCVTGLVGLIIIVLMAQRQWGNLAELFIVFVISFTLSRYVSLRKKQQP